MATQSSRYSLNKNKYLLDDDYEGLIGLLKTYLKQDTRNCVLLLIALQTGARATEILRLKTSDIDHENKTVLIKGIKGSNDREIPLYPYVFNELVKLESKDDLVFPISYNRLRQIWQHYRPTHKKFHSLRHTFAIRLYKKTKDIRLVQVALGHRNITNTMVYAEYVYTQQELKRLIL